jgi:large subunit ribosomal protein L13
MLPYKKAAGREALSRLRVYVGAPTELASVATEILDDAYKSRLSTIKAIELKKISDQLGAKK